MQSDEKTWKRIESRSLEGSEFLTSDVCEVIRLQKFDCPIEIDGERFVINKETPISITEDNDDNRLYYNFHVARDFFPILPSKEQLISVLRQGDDRNSNSLILNVYGFFELRARECINIISDPTIIFRNETFQAGNGYAGVESSNDKRFVDAMYLEAIIHWKKHLETGITGLYSDDMHGGYIENLINEIENLKVDFERQIENDYR